MSSSFSTFIIDVFSSFEILRRWTCALVAGSSKWDCLDSSFSQNNHRSCVEWKQVYCCWQEADWGTKPQWEREVTNSTYFCSPSKFLNFQCLFCFSSLMYGINETHSIFLFASWQYFFAIKPIERAIKNDIAKESRPSWELRDTGVASRKFWFGYEPLPSWNFLIVGLFSCPDHFSIS